MQNTPTIGILGGMSSVATAEYYRIIHEKVKKELGGHHAPELLIRSVNFALIEKMIKQNNWTAMANYLATNAKKLEKGGASCVMMASNTVHKVSPAIKEALSIPFLDIFDCTAEQIIQNGMRKAGLLGTFPVMDDVFYSNHYATQGVETISPNEVDKIEINRIIFSELTRQQFLASSKQYYINVIKKLVDAGAQCIILGCTEIKLLIQSEDVPFVPLFDTLEIHCDKAVAITTGKLILQNLR